MAVIGGKINKYDPISTADGVIPPTVLGGNRVLMER